MVDPASEPSHTDAGGGAQGKPPPPSVSVDDLGYCLWSTCLCVSALTSLTLVGIPGLYAVLQFGVPPTSAIGDVQQLGFIHRLAFVQGCIYSVFLLILSILFLVQISCCIYRNNSSMYYGSTIIWDGLFMPSIVCLTGIVSMHKFATRLRTATKRCDGLAFVDVEVRGATQSF